MNLIQSELFDAKARMLTLIEGTELVALTHDNVAMVEAMIMNDSAYIKSHKTDAAPTYKRNGDMDYGGSTAYWMTRLKNIISNGGSRYDYERVVKGAVAAVDRENSTHLSADGVGLSELTKRITQIKRDKLVKLLREPEETNFELIRTLAQETHPTGKSRRGAKYHPRKNPSFASKFCHYACFYLFEGNVEQDNYSIFDNIVKRALPLYVDYYGIEKLDLNDYVSYSKTIGQILKISGAKISRNGFDHLLWYYFKGREHLLKRKRRKPLVSV